VRNRPPAGEQRGNRRSEVTAGCPQIPHRPQAAGDKHRPCWGRTPAPIPDARPIPLPSPMRPCIPPESAGIGKVSASRYAAALLVTPHQTVSRSPGASGNSSSCPESFKGTGIGGGSGGMGWSSRAQSLPESVALDRFTIAAASRAPAGIESARIHLAVDVSTLPSPSQHIPMPIERNPITRGSWDLLASAAVCTSGSAIRGNPHDQHTLSATEHLNSVHAAVAVRV